MINPGQSVTGGPHVNGALTIRAYMATQFLAAQLPMAWQYTEQARAGKTKEQVHEMAEDFDKTLIRVFCEASVEWADALIEQLNKEEPPK